MEYRRTLPNDRQILPSRRKGSIAFWSEYDSLASRCKSAHVHFTGSKDASWIPVDIAGTVIAEIALAKTSLPHVLHVENPQRRPWQDILHAVVSSVRASEMDWVQFSEWLHLVQAQSDPVVNPASKIIEFLENSFIRLATGTVVLDTTVARSVSPTLRTLGGMSDEEISEYIQYWKRTRFLE